VKPERILAEAPKRLRQAEREFYFENGYLLLEGLIEGEELARLQEATRGFVEASRKHASSDEQFDLEPGHSAASPRLRRLNKPVEYHPAYWQFASDSAITDVAEDLLGPNVKFHHSKLNFKWADGGEEVKWHQDIPFYPHTNYGVLAIGLYLADVDDEMGPMGIIPGSHKGAIYNHYNARDQWVGALDDADAARLPVASTAWLKGKAGSVTVHHCRAVHGSMPNRSARGRPLLINAFSSADALTVTPHPAPCRYTGAIVRGQPARWAEFDDTPCLIPPDWSAGYTSIFALQQEEGGARTTAGMM
jgi:ectoine hydroxylase-related dioxygenase (phytanoyl-CoA dioxygenase family)